MMNRKHIRNGLIGAALVLLAAAALVRGWDAPSLLPFKAEEVNEIEMYQYIVPAATQKKTVSGPDQMAQVCRRIAAASVQPRTDEQSYTGGETTIFRFHLQNESTFEICFTEPHFVRCTDGAVYQTPSNLGGIWKAMDVPAESVPENELF